MLPNLVILAAALIDWVLDYGKDADLLHSSTHELDEPCSIHFGGDAGPIWLPQSQRLEDYGERAWAAGRRV